MCMCESNANELPSSFLFIQIRVHTYIHARRAGILGNEKERAREREREHAIILGHDDAMGIFVFASPAKKNRT